MGNFSSFLRLSSQILRRYDNFLRISTKNSWVVGGHIVLLASLLMLLLLLASLYYLWHPCCCVSPFCCWRCDVPIVSAAVGPSILLPASLCLQTSLLLMVSILCWRSCCYFHSFCCLHSCWSWCLYFSWWLYILDCRMWLITLSDYGCRIVTFLLSNYWNIEYRIGEFEKLSGYLISDKGLNLSDNQILPTSAPSTSTWIIFDK